MGKFAALGAFATSLGSLGDLYKDILANREATAMQRDIAGFSAPSQPTADTGNGLASVGGQPTLTNAPPPPPPALDVPGLSNQPPQAALAAPPASAASLPTEAPKAPPKPSGSTGQPDKPLWMVYQLAAASAARRGNAAGAAALMKQSDTLRTAELDQHTKELALQKASLGMIASHASALKAETDPLAQQIGYQALVESLKRGPMPEYAASLPPTVTPEALDHLSRLGDDAAIGLARDQDLLNRQRQTRIDQGIIGTNPDGTPKYSDERMAGDTMYVARSLATARNNADYLAKLAYAQQRFQGTVNFSSFPAAWSADAKKALDDMALTAEQSQTAGEHAAALTETHRANVAREAAEQQRIALEKKKIDLSGGVAADPEAVASWVRQLRNPSSGVAIGQVPMNIRTAVMKQLQPGEVTKLTQQSQAMKETAQSVIPIVTKVTQMADQIKQLGLMGTVGGRFRQLVSKESAASDLAGLTDEQKRLVGQFTTEAGLLVSGVAKAHGGSRGGGSIQMIENLKPLLDPNNKDLETYLGNLEGAMEVLNGYAHMGETGQTPQGPETRVVAGLTLTKQPDGTWKSPSGAIYEDGTFKRIK